MTNPIKYTGLAALAACVSLVMSSCGSDSSSESGVAITSLNNRQILNVDNGDLADEELRMTSLEFTATASSYISETGTVDFKMNSAYGEWTVSKANYDYKSASGTITIYAGDAQLTSGNVSVSYSDFTLIISADVSMENVISGNVDMDEYAGYQTASTVVISGDLDGDGAVDEDDLTKDDAYSTTAKIVAQPILIKKMAN